LPRVHSVVMTQAVRSIANLDVARPTFPVARPVAESEEDGAMNIEAAKEEKLRLKAEAAEASRGRQRGGTAGASPPMAFTADCAADISSSASNDDILGSDRLKWSI